MENIQQEIIDRLNETQAFESEEAGYQRYMRRELFEQFLYSAYGLEFCGCGNQEQSLEAVVRALEFAATVSNKDRSLVLMKAFGVEKVSDDALVQVLFYLLTAKGFIEHDDEDSVNDSELTEAGSVFLPMLKNYVGE
jgi:hypothetical protein